MSAVAAGLLAIARGLLAIDGCQRPVLARGGPLRGCAATLLRRAQHDFRAGHGTPIVGWRSFSGAALAVAQGSGPVARCRCDIALMGCGVTSGCGIDACLSHQLAIAAAAIANVGRGVIPGDVGAGHVELAGGPIAIG